MRLHRLRLGMFVLAAISGCFRPGHLSSRCSLAPTRAVWTDTDAPGRIEGTVSDLQDDTPIGNLQLRLDGRDRAVRTDTAGAFRFDSLPDGRYIVTTEGSVYQSRSDTLALPLARGLRGVIGLATGRDALRRCELYHP